jgi:hypothetical protein
MGHVYLPVAPPYPYLRHDGYARGFSPSMQFDLDRQQPALLHAHTPAWPIVGSCSASGVPVNVALHKMRHDLTVAQTTDRRISILLG